MPSLYLTPKGPADKARVYKLGKQWMLQPRGWPFAIAYSSWALACNHLANIEKVAKRSWFR